MLKASKPTNSSNTTKKYTIMLPVIEDEYFPKMWM